MFGSGGDEDPERMLRRLIEDMKQSQREAESHVEAVAQEEAAMRSRRDEADRECAGQTAVARLAESRGDHVAAERARRAADEASRQSSAWSKELEKQSLALAQLRAALAAMAEKVALAEHQADVLVSRARSAGPNSPENNG